MSQTFNVYCDESCHLENDHQQVMVLGAVWCPLDSVDEILIRLREIKERHNINPQMEVKWTKVSPGKKQFYLDIIDYFFDDDDLHFRALIVPDKSQLQLHASDHSHDDWYYKLYFSMLKAIFDPEAHYRIYLDIKDTCSAVRVAHLHEVLRNDIYDFKGKIIERVQTVRSHEVQILQMADLLIGAVSYANRKVSTSPAKQALVERMRKRSGYELTRSTLVLEKKVNLFRWQPSEEAL